MATRPAPARIRLLKFVTLFGIGGTERQVVNLGLGLDPARIELRFACFRRVGHLLPELEARHIPLESYDIHRLYGLQALRQQLRFRRHLRREQIDIVHTYGFYPNVFGVPAARLARAPVVIASIRDTGVYLTPRQRAVQRAACRLADCVLVNAEAVKDWLVSEGYRPSRIVVIRNGIDLSRFTVAPRPGRASIRRELGLRPETSLVTMVSRLSRSKGVEHLLEAAALIAKRVPSAHFVIVGNGFAVKDGIVIEDAAYRSTLEHHAQRLGLAARVAFTGFRIDVPEILADSTVSVLPSLSEGLSNAIIESMAAGLPVVATRVGGNPEAVEEGVTGLLVPPGEPVALARALCQVLEHPERARSFGEAGRRRVREEFSLERMVRDTERIYLELLARRRPLRRRAWAGSTSRAPDQATAARDR
jgi:glycosyltransferase involved in cell wall biosynthesis